MHPIAPPVSTALVLVCEKCGKRMNSDENPSRELVSRLKKGSKEIFARGEVRAALTSCLDICPENRISVAIVPVAGSTAPPRFFAVKADDVAATAQKILKEIRKPLP